MFFWVLIWMVLAVVYVVTFLTSLTTGVARLGGWGGGSVSKSESPRMYAAYLCMQLLMAGFFAWMGVSAALDLVRASNGNA